MSNHRTYLYLVAVVFGLVALAHLLRLINGWPLNIADVSVPVWISWPGMLVAALLSGWGLLLTRKLPVGK